MLALLLGCAFHVPPPAAGEATPLPFVTHAEDRERLYVEVDGHLWFVDTGATRTTCDDDYVATLGLESRWVPAWSKGRIGTVPVRRVVLPDVDVAGWRWPKVACAVRDLGTTSSLPDDPRVAGVLGANLLRHFVVELDLDDERLALRAGGGREGMPLRREWGIGPRLIVEVEVGEARARAVVDTGADHTHLPLTEGPVIRRYRGERRGTGPTGRMEVEVVIRGAPVVTVGGVPLPLAWYIESEHSPGLLGLDALAGRRVEIDFPHRRLRIEAAASP